MNFALLSDPPKILSVDKDRVKTATLFSPANFECVGEGNPLPTYQWLQTLPTPSNLILERGREAKLHIPNVTYDLQGEYRCKVTNVINGQERSEMSYPIILQVVGEYNYILNFSFILCTFHYPFRCCHRYYPFLYFLLHRIPTLN